MPTKTKTTVVPQYSEEQIEAMRLEGIAPIDPEDGRLDLARRYLELREVKNRAEAEMKEIGALLKEDCARNDLRELHYNGSKLVSINSKRSRNTDLDKLFKEYPEAYKNTVTESESVSINFSKIKE